MKKFLIIGLTIMLTGLAATAMAERSTAYDGYSAGNDRGDRIEARFDRKADRAAAHGQYRKAYRLKEKGERINRRLDYKGKGHGGRYAGHWKQHHKHQAGYAMPRHHRYGDRVRLGVFVPGFWFSGVWHD
jgi:hypothetical protein